jgi:hypothetical protein
MKVLYYSPWEIKIIMVINVIEYCGSPLDLRVIYRYNFEVKRSNMA